VLLTLYESMTVMKRNDQSLNVTKEFYEKYEGNENDFFMINPDLTKALYNNPKKEIFLHWFKK